MKIERILVPTDFSEHSLAALKYAIELTREYGPEVLLVHVVEPLPYGIARWSEPTKLLESYAETASSELERFEKEATQLYLKCRSELHFGVGNDDPFGSGIISGIVIYIYAGRLQGVRQCGVHHLF